MTTTDNEPIRVLYVGDDSETPDRIQRGFDREPHTFDLTTVASADAGLAVLAETPVDCVVSEYDLPGTDGIGFVRAVRDDLPDVPFVLLDDGYSEDVARTAISAGATDYRRKKRDAEYGFLTKRISDAVHRQRNRIDYHELFEKIPDGVTLHGPDGSVLDANRQFAEMLGYSREELLGIGFDALHVDEPPYTGDRAEQLVRKAATEGPQTFEWVDKTKAGERLPVEVHLRRTLVDGKERVLAVVRDITERKERERRLRHRVTAMDSSMNGMAILDEDDRYTYVNPSHAEIYGYDDPDAFLGESWEMCYTDDEVAEFEERVFPVLETEGRWRGEAIGKRRDGSSFPQELTLTALDDGGLICVVRDISDRRERKRELERKTALLETTQRMASVGGWELDLRDDELRWTDEIYRMYGLALDAEPELGSALEVVHPEDTPRIETAIERAIEDGEGYDIELRLLTANDELRWVRALGEPHREHGETVVLRGAFQDVTERKRGVQELARRNGMIESLHAATRDMVVAADAEQVCRIAVDAAEQLLDLPITGIWLVDETDRRLDPVATSASGETVVGELPVYTAEEANLSWEAFERGETQVYDDLRTEATPVNPETPIRSEIVVPLGDYGVMNFGSLTENAFDEIDVHVAELLGANTVTALERVERERELDTQMDRMEFFNSILRHDVLNGMTVIRGRAELLADELDGDQLRDAETILDWSDDIVEIVRRVRTTLDALTDGSSVRLESIELSATLRKEVDRVRETYPEVTFETEIPEPVYVRANEFLSEVLGNVVTNAVEHNDPEGLRVSIAVSKRNDDDTAVVRIADNGTGVPDEARKTIFRRDATGHAKSSGSGYGLFFVDSMIESYGGDVWVEDNDAGGATFVLELPLADSTAPA